MVLTIEDADLYITSYVIDNPDWLTADEAKKTRTLNVAARTLENKYPDYVIPNEAVYELAAALAIVFNDTNRMNQQGLAGFSVTGVGSFTFKESAAKASLEDVITPEVKAIIGKENNVQLVGRVLKVVIM